MAPNYSEDGASPAVRITAIRQRDWKPRSIEQLRAVLSMVCNFVWTKQLRPGEHMWSIPADEDRDFDCILSDAISELEDARERLALLGGRVSPPPQDIHENRQPIKEQTDGQLEHQHSGRRRASQSEQSERCGSDDAKVRGGLEESGAHGGERDVHARHEGGREALRPADRATAAAELTGALEAYEDSDFDDAALHMVVQAARHFADTQGRVVGVPPPPIDLPAFAQHIVRHAFEETDRTTMLAVVEQAVREYFKMHGGISPPPDQEVIELRIWQAKIQAILSPFGGDAKDAAAPVLRELIKQYNRRVPPPPPALDYRGVLERLVAKLDEVIPAVDGIIAFNYIRSGRQYNGPNLIEELKAAKAILDLPPDPPAAGGA